MRLSLALFNCFYLGKLSVLTSLFITLLARLLLGNPRVLNRAKVVLSYLLVLILAGANVIVLRMLPWLNALGLPTERLGAGRNDLWETYWQLFLSFTPLRKLIGGYYVHSTNGTLGPALNHPHNQFLTILVCFGLCGALLYGLLIAKALKSCLFRGEVALYLYVIALTAFMIADDYFFLAPNAFLTVPLFYCAFRDESRAYRRLPEYGRQRLSGLPLPAGEHGQRDVKRV